MTGTVQVVVPERGTGLRRSAVIKGMNGEYLWLRRPGTDAPAPFRHPAPELLDRFRRLRTALGSRARTSTTAGGWSGYAMRAPRSLWEELLIGERPATCASTQTAVRELGRLLRSIHDLSRPAVEEDALEADTQPPALSRVREWLCRGHGASPRAERVTSVVRGGVGGGRWDALAAWSSELATPLSAVHGWFGLGHVAVCERGTGPTVDLAIGEDVGWAAPALDVGFGLGQLEELSTFLPGSEAAAAELRSALVAGYGDTPAGSSKAAAVQVALHIHDFGHYFDVRDDELPHWTDLLSRLVDQAS